MHFVAACSERVKWTCNRSAHLDSLRGSRALFPDILARKGWQVEFRDVRRSGPIRVLIAVVVHRAKNPVAAGGGVAGSSECQPVGGCRGCGELAPNNGGNVAPAQGGVGSPSAEPTGSWFDHAFHLPIPAIKSEQAGRPDTLRR